MDLNTKIIETASAAAADADAPSSLLSMVKYHTRTFTREAQLVEFVAEVSHAYFQADPLNLRGEMSDSDVASAYMGRVIGLIKRATR